MAQIFYLLSDWPALFFQKRVEAAVFFSRIASALAGTLSVLFLALTTRRLWDEKTTRWAAWVAALCPGIITHAHFGTVDMPQFLFLCAGLWSAARLFERRERKDIILCGMILGLGTAVKFQGWLMIFPALISLCHSRGSGNPVIRKILILLFSTLAGFLLGMPWLWLNPMAAVKWWLHHAFVVSVPRGLIGDYAWKTHGLNLIPLLGPSIFLVLIFVIAKAAKAACGNLIKEFSFIRLLRPRLAMTEKFIFLLSAVLPFYFLTGSFRFTPLRYSLALLPGLLLCAGWALSRLNKLQTRGVLTAAALFTVWLDLGFVFDSRFGAARWIESNTGSEDTFEIASYSPRIKGPMRVWTGYSSPRDPLVIKPIPEWLKPLAESVAPMEMAVARADALGQIPEPLGERFNREALVRRRTRYVVLTDWYVERYHYPLYAKANPMRASYYLDFWEERMPDYALIKRFKFFPGAWWAPRPEFVDPEIRIYRLQ